MSKHRPTPDVCPVCGASVPPGARSCPECGADERSGWDEEASHADGLDLPDSAWEDGDGGDGDRERPARAPTGVSWLWWAVAALLAAALLAWVLRLR